MHQGLVHVWAGDPQTGRSLVKVLLRPRPRVAARDIDLSISVYLDTAQRAQQTLHAWHELEPAADMPDGLRSSRPKSRRSPASYPVGSSTVALRRMISRK